MPIERGSAVGLTSLRRVFGIDVDQRVDQGSGLIRDGCRELLVEDGIREGAEGTL
jgi:hypothetical protein